MNGFAWVLSAAGVGSAILGWSVNWGLDICNRIDQKRIIAKHEAEEMALKLYAETGRNYPEVVALGRRAIATAAELRTERLAQKERESTEFVAVCECPACGRVDLHWIRDGTRICRSCSHEWKQS